MLREPIVIRGIRAAITLDAIVESIVLAVAIVVLGILLFVL